LNDKVASKGGPVRLRHVRVTPCSIHQGLYTAAKAPQSDSKGVTSTPGGPEIT